MDIWAHPICMGLANCFCHKGKRNSPLLRLILDFERSDDPGFYFYTKLLMNGLINSFGNRTRILNCTRVADVSKLRLPENTERNCFYMSSRPCSFRWHGPRIEKCNRNLSTGNERPPVKWKVAFSLFLVRLYRHNFTNARQTYWPLLVNLTPSCDPGVTMNAN